MRYQRKFWYLEIGITVFLLIFLIEGSVSWVLSGALPNTALAVAMTLFVVMTFLRWWRQSEEI